MSLQSNALYFPYIHVRSDTWVKAAALYWSGLARIVPHGYPTHDSETVRALTDDLDFIQNLGPNAAAAEVSPVFEDFIRKHGEQLAQKLAVAASTRLVQPSDEDPLGYVYATKMTPSLRRSLLEHGLATTRRSNMHHPPRYSAGIDRDRWIGMDARLAGVYMCVLTEVLARRNHLAPVTDQPVAHALVGEQFSLGRLARALLDIDLELLPPAPRDAPDETAVAFAALEVDVPRDLAGVPVSKIIELRQAHADEFLAFQEAVRGMSRALAALPVDPDPKVAQMFFRQELERTFAAPRKELRRAMRSMRLDIAQSVLNLKVAAPTILASTGVAVQSEYVIAGGAALGVVAIAQAERDRKVAARHRLASASYLLRVDRLRSPAAAVRLGRKLLRRAMRG